MSISAGTKMVIEFIKREAIWRDLCLKSGVDPKDTKLYKPSDLPKDSDNKK